MLHLLDVVAERVVRDGRVAVLVSPGFGAGWSTWADRELRERLLFDPEVVAWVTAAFVLWNLFCDRDKKIMVVSASKQRADDFSIFCQRCILEFEPLRLLHRAPPLIVD